MKTLAKIVPNLLPCLLLLSGASEIHAMPSSCEETGGTHIWISPADPGADRAVKVMAVSTDGPLSELSLVDSDGLRIPLHFRRRGGPPWSLVGAVNQLQEGNYRVIAGAEGQLAACHPLAVGKADKRAKAVAWGLGTEAFYSAWIEELFGAPPEENLNFPSLEPVLRNAGRNFLHNHLGLNEDQNLPLTPDCADLPYTLRAYFAWKIGLPIAFRTCSRGTVNAPPKCGPASIRSDFIRRIRAPSDFRNIIRALSDAVHSGSARTSLDDDLTDLYPVPLSQKTLWPGTVYADPYGHVMVIVEWVPQTKDSPGILLAVDAQPDNTVARKRFWEGTFLFANSRSAGPGFKAFRPLVSSPLGGWRALSNDELVDHPGFAPYSAEQNQLTPEDFYSRMARLINPEGLGPEGAYEAALNALVEQIETRVTSVESGEKYFQRNPGTVIAMPSGAAIFQTTGPWEDYSTPSRDMRLIIAINVLNGLPEKIVRHPELFVMEGRSPEEARAEIESRHSRRIRERSIRYTRSDGSSWMLSVAEVLARRPAYEMTYNPNDCAEIRWGAEPGTEEYATCRRHAPAEQRAKMERYRLWFREARRPVR